MKRLILTAAMMALYGACFIATAQQLVVTVVMNRTPSPYISDWRSNPNTIQFFVTNPTGQPVEARFSGYIEGEKRGRVAETKLEAKIAPVTIPPGASTFNGIDAHLIEEGAVRYLGPTRAETQRSGRLPEDNYRLCIQLVAVDEPWAPLSNVMCAPFEIRLLLPPSLIAPANTSSIGTPPAFQWTPVPLTPGKFAGYELRLVELDPGQTNAASAMESNLPVIVRQTAIPTYQYMPSDPQLEKGKRYAWRIRAFDPDDRYTFANKGLSEIWTFDYNPVVPKALQEGLTPIAVGPVEKLAIDKTKKLGLTPSYSFLPNFPFKALTRASGKLLTTFISGQIPKARSIIVEQGGSGPKGLKLGVSPSLGQAGLSVNPMLPPGKEAKALGGIHLNLYVQMKTNPACTYYPYRIDGKTYDTRVLVATTTTQADGSFNFMFFSTDSCGRIMRNASVNCGSGEFANHVTADVYRYYTVEVADPHLCSPSDEFAIQPGEEANLGTLYSLVQWYNATIHVQDVYKKSPMNFMDVQIVRRWRPYDVPPNEGSLHPHESYTAIASAPASEVIAEGKTSGNGDITFKYLPRCGGSDFFDVIVKSPEQGAYYYYTGWKTFAHRFGLSEKDDAGNTLPFIYARQNEDWKAPDYKATVIMNVVPKKPRILGQVYRKDNPLKPVVGAKVELWAWAGILPVKLRTILSNDSGGFSFEDLAPITNDANFYFLKIDKYGFKVRTYPENLGSDVIRLEMGQQRHTNHILIEPALLVTGRVIDETGRPVAANVRIGDGEFVHTTQHAISLGMVQQMQTQAQAQAGQMTLQPKNPMIQSVKMKTFTPMKALQKIYKSHSAQYVVKEEFTTPAPYGVYWMYVQPDNQAMFYPETLLVVLPQNASDIGEFTVSMKLHRLAVRAVEHTSVVSGGIYKKGAKAYMSYNQFLVSTISKVIPDAVVRVNGEAPDSVDANGVSYFAWLSPSDLATVTVEGPPNSDYITKEEVQVTVDESKEWNQLEVELEKGGSITGTVKIRDLPVANARVMLYDNPADTDPVFTTTDATGKYTLRRLPTGMHVFRASKASSQYVGDTAKTLVKASQTATLDFQLTMFADMDITRLLGFPIEVAALDSGAGGYSITGNFTELPDNAQFAAKDTGVALHFSNIVIVPSSEKNANGVPYAEPKTVPMVTSIDSWDLTAFGLYKAVQHDATHGIRVNKSGTQGNIVGKVSLDPSSYTFPGGTIDFGTQMIALANAHTGGEKLLLPAITSDASAPSVDPNGFFAMSENGNSLRFAYYDFPATADSSRSFFNGDTLRLASTLHTDIPDIITRDLALDIGDIRIHKSSVESMFFGDSLVVPLEADWAVRSENWKITSGGLTLNKGIVDAGGLVGVKFTNMKILPTQLLYGVYDLTSLPVANVTTMAVNGDVAFGVDGGTGHWMIAVAPDPGEEVCASIPGLPGFGPGQQIEFDNFYARADGGSGFSVKSGNLVTLYKVGQYTVNQFFPAKGIIQVAGNLDLDIPLLPIKNFICSYSKAGGDLVFAPDPISHTIDVNGVDIVFQTGGTSPQYFDNNGYHSRVIVKEDGAFAVNAMLHRTLSGTEVVINDGEEIPIGPAVKFTAVEGEMHVASASWTNFWFEGDLQSNNQGGRLRFDVIGEIVANGQAIGVEDISTPFGDISLVYNFDEDRLEGTLHVEQDLAGTKVEGDATLLISGSGKGWYFFCGAAFEMPNPKVEGTAALLFGNWSLEPEQLNQFKQYSYKNKPLPSQFHNLSGFFFEGTVKFPPPVFCPNFDFDFGLVSAHLICQIGANARLGMNFGPVNTYFVAFRGIAKLEAGIGASIIIACGGLTAGLEIEPSIEGMYQSDGTWYVMGDFPITLYGETYCGWGICDSDCDGALCDKESASAQVTLGLKAYIGSDDKYFDFYFK